MSKIQIYYFSGTGNTRFIIHKVAEGLRDLGNEVIVNSCEEVQAINNEFDVLGIAFPIHSSYAPRVFTEFLDRLPNANGVPLFGVVTSGYIAGDVLTFVGRKLVDKGYNPFLYRNIVVGNNLHLPVLCPLKVTSQEKIRERLDRIDSKVLDIASKINNRTKDISGNNILGKVFGVAQRNIGKIGEELNFKGFTADEKCTKCQWCVKHCPTDNIVFDGEKIVFEDKCIICMRCYNFCPFKAIQMTDRTKNIGKYKRYSGPEGLGARTLFNK